MEINFKLLETMEQAKQSLAEMEKATDVTLVKLYRDGKVIHRQISAQ